MTNEMFFEKIQFKCFSLFKAHDLADSNFKLHKSIEFLDLSTNNCPSRFSETSTKCVLTKEDLRKRFIPDRRILYNFHLDLPTDLENCFSSKTTVIVEWNAIHLRKIYVCDSVFNRGLEKHIVSAIQKDGGNKIEKLRSYMKILKLLNFKDFEPVFYLYDNILPILYNENCADSELVRSFVTMSDFAGWVCHSPDREVPQVLEYVLSQAQRAGYMRDLWLFPYTEMYPVTVCLLTGKMQYMLLLIKYGIDTSVPLDLEFDDYTEKFEVFDRAADEGNLKYSRVFRIFQVFCSFDQYRQNSPEGLRYLWRSIKEPFLSQTEIVSILSQEFLQETATRVIKYYENFIEKDCSLRPTPRSMKDMCRVEIRKLLKDNCKLPFGISDLKLPKIVKSYLNLEI